MGPVVPPLVHDDAVLLYIFGKYLSRPLHFSYLSIYSIDILSNLFKLILTASSSDNPLRCRSPT
jgi:hypothetical protein